ncbi:Sec7 domain-containing protein, partial [Blastocladiella britannica]
MTLNATQSRVDKAQRAAREHKAVLRQALDLFWSSPKKGIDFLVRQGALPGNAETHPADVARFMFETPGIDKASIGDYIARPSYAPLLAAYMAQFDFSGLRIDQALRKMMLKFRLPGESQMIDRVLECFARHFFQQNPNQDEIADVDAGFILAFSIIMLNTDQHNPQVRNRMNVDSFCRNLRGLNHSADFDRAFLEEVFTAIHHEEII